jgi:hypothetical protein
LFAITLRSFPYLSIDWYTMYMNDFSAKKLGEVLAFNRIGEDNIQKASATLTGALGDEKVMDMGEKFRMHGEEILRIATDAGVVDTTLAQSVTDEQKLKTMRTDYMGDRFDSDTEVFEWLGFFHGALIAHFGVLKGIAQGLEHEGLSMIAEEGVNWNYEMLEQVESELESRGQDNATA